MKAVRAHQTGGPEVLRYEDAPVPEIGPGQALVDVRSIGVNYTDVASRNGLNPPGGFRGRLDGRRPGGFRDWGRSDGGGRGRPGGIRHAHRHLRRAGIGPFLAAGQTAF